MISGGLGVVAIGNFCMDVDGWRVCQFYCRKV